ncbi:MAG TPA: mannose-1-phosphate guanylyltransferase [Bryobacteraceae bacterium]|nr:mannose-1-phosphate guanylyltransferase [Bryobacteraceae bacterium]
MAASEHSYALILAGGRGTRFWPRSRKRSAKQVLTFDGERSLIQQTVDRLGPVIPPERVWIITNDYLRDTIIKQLPEVPKEQIIAEPAQRNTAPAIGLVAQILERQDPDAVMGVFPADHIIEKPKRYLRLVRPAYAAAKKGQICVLGILPRWPETGYGYIEFPFGVTAGGTETLKVERFTEKPNLETAKEFVAAGTYYWNAGMFFWRASVFLDELRQHMPKTAETLAALPAFGSRTFKRKLAELFPQCENTSVDFGIIEKSNRVSGIACDDFGWNDVGSWNAVYELQASGLHANVLRSPDVFTELSEGCYVDVPKKLVALVGVKDLVVVETDDALLVVDRHRAQNVSDIVKALERAKREELL